MDRTSILGLRAGLYCALPLGAGVLAGTIASSAAGDLTPAFVGGAAALSAAAGVVLALRGAASGEAWQEALERERAQLREVEETLRASEDWYRRIIDTASEGLLVLDGEGRIAYVNRRLERMLETRADRMLGRPAHDFVAAEDRTQAEVFFRNLKPDCPVQRDFRVRKPDGAPAWVMISASGIRTERGALGALAMITDITERRQAEEALRFLARASSRLGSTLDPAATLRSVAELAVPALGEGCSIDLITPRGTLEPDLQAGRPPEETDAEMTLPLAAQGRTLGTLTLSRRAPAYTAEDLALAEDLAARASAALENARLYQEVQEAGRAKDEFLAMLAHELRNPLGALRNALEIIRRAPTGSGAGDRALAVADRQLIHQARMVDDLLDVSRLTLGRIDLQRTRLDFCGVVRDALSDHQASFKQGDVLLTAQLPAAPLLVDGDVTRLSQVLANLLQNALKFSDPGGGVHVQLRELSGSAELTVSDNGIGIEPEMLPRVFESFAQADRSLARARGGLGLGLALVRGLVELHGGAVEARSPGAGKGSEFILRLPLIRDVGYEPGVEGPLETGAARRVVVVEDIPDAAETLKDLLELAGHEVVVAADGVQGVEAVRRHHPDVVLCDIGLPRMDGYEVARRVREEQVGSGPLLVALTGYGLPTDRSRALEAGFDAHVTKPIRLEELLALIKG